MNAPMSEKTQTNFHPIFLTCLIVFQVISGYLISLSSPEPYMDEPFHIEQTRVFCKFDFETWDPKITTLPGTYFLHLIFTFPFQLCGSIFSARILHWVFYILCCTKIYSVMQLLYPNINSTILQLRAISISLLPYSWFFFNLYYTDGPAIFFILATFESQIRKSKMAFVLPKIQIILYSIGAVLLRQTNIVWCAFSWGFNVLHRFNIVYKPPGRNHFISKPSKISTKSSKYKNRRKFVNATQNRPPNYSFSKIPNLSLTGSDSGIASSIPMFVTFGLFVGFLWWNDWAIVVGDHSAHVPTFHAAQINYFFLALMPFLSFNIPFYTKSISKHSSFSFFLGLTSLCFTYMCSKYTIAHPYLLADNRHYSFYVWKDILSQYPTWIFSSISMFLSCIDFGILPLDIAKGFTVESETKPKRLIPFLNSRRFMLFLGFMLCCSFVLIPTPLFEFRYFIVPVTFFALLVPPQTVIFESFRIFVFLVINSCTVYMFTTKPFKDPSGNIAHFMW